MKIKKCFLILLSAAAVFAGLQGCTKTCPDFSKTNLSFTDSMLFLPAHKYWVYYDSLSGTTDQVKVIYDSVTRTNYEGNCSQAVNYSITLKGFGHLLSDTLAFTTLYGSQIQLNFPRQQSLRILPDTLGWIPDRNLTYKTQQPDTLRIGGNLYHNPITFIDTTGKAKLYSITFAPNIGIVRLQMFGDTLGHQPANYVLKSFK